jgi:DNA-binding transcriptional regulator YiaG
MACEDAKIPVKEIRGMFGLTVNEFSFRFGFDPSEVRRWESGDATPSRANKTLLILLERLPDEVMEVLSFN